MRSILVRGSLARENDGWCDCTYSRIRAEVDQALQAGEDILLDFDSSGGEAIGVHDLADYVFAHRDKIVAHVSGCCASAAYYLASACREISAAEDAVIGSIGSMARRVDEPGMVVAKLSPKKNSGEDLQALVDDACERFLTDVAKYRGIEGSLEEVADRVGMGALMPAREALNRGLIDRINSEEVMADDQMDQQAQAAVDAKLIEKLAEFRGDMEERLARVEASIAALVAKLEEAKAEDVPEETPAEPMAEEDESKKALRDCLLAELKSSGKLQARDEASAVKLLSADPELFKSLFVEREPMAQTRVSMAAKSTEPQGKTRAERARQYAAATGCTFQQALAHEIEKGK